MNAIADVRRFPQPQYQQVETRFDAEFGVYWAHMNPRPRACFNLQLLAELSSYATGIADSGGIFRHQGAQHAIGYAVIASKVPGVFNLGGDLALFKQAILEGNREQLVAYGRKCVTNLFPWHRNFDLPLTTISLVQGDALGGGFECALSSAVLIAEESARMGFPEILFNLFPGMGAYSFLSRKVGRRLTEEMITSGTIYGARQLFEMGVVDVVAPDGMGEAAVYAYVKKHAKAANARRAIEQVRNNFEPVTLEELMRVVEIWADAAVKLNTRDIKMMDRLVRAQQRNTIEAAEDAAVGASNVVRLEAIGAGD